MSVAAVAVALAVVFAAGFVVGVLACLSMMRGLVEAVRGTLDLITQALKERSR